MYGNIQFSVNSPVQNRVVIKKDDFGSLGTQPKKSTKSKPPVKPVACTNP